MNFYFPKKNLVFIHIKKAGGSSIRKAMEIGDKPKKAMGLIPEEWQGAKSFAVVRHPVDRFLSAVNMFRMGAEEPGSSSMDYANPTLPDLTITQALDIIEDDSIGFDRSIRKPFHNLKHHLWPQTHIFFCLNKAEKILRFEKLNSEFNEFTQDLGLSCRLEWKRRTQGRPESFKAEDINPDEMNRIKSIFADDFIKLGYLIPSKLEKQYSSKNTGILQLKKHVNYTRSVWPQYFGNVEGDTLNLSDALPCPDANISALRDEIIPGDKGKTWPNRNRNIIDHFRSLEPEFNGRSRLSHLLACIIVVLRRNPENTNAQTLFHRITVEHGQLLTSDLNLRWLASVCDTFLDIGQNGEDRAIAMIGSMAMAMVKLSETERRIYYPAIPWPPKVRFRNGGEMFDGVISFWAQNGDMIDNLMQRFDTIKKSHSPATPFAAEIISRISKQHSAIARFRKINGMKQPKLADNDLHKLIILAIREEAGETVDITDLIGSDKDNGEHK